MSPKRYWHVRVALALTYLIQSAGLAIAGQSRGWPRSMTAFLVTVGVASALLAFPWGQRQRP